MENPFSLKGKTTGETPNNFTIIKSITIILVYVSRRKKNLLVFLFSQTLSLCVLKAATLCSLLLDYFLEGGNTLLSPPLLSSRRWQCLTLSFLLRSSQAKIPFFSVLVSRSIFPLPREDSWAKAKVKTSKFFVALSIYKTLFIFPLELGIHYFFNKE